MLDVLDVGISCAAPRHVGEQFSMAAPEMQLTNICALIFRCLGRFSPDLLLLFTLSAVFPFSRSFLAEK